MSECDGPTPMNGKVTSTDASNGYVFGNYAEIDCSVGYELKGDNVITCNVGGVWSDLPSCELKGLEVFLLITWHLICHLHRISSRRLIYKLAVIKRAI